MARGSSTASSADTLAYVGVLLVAMSTLVLEVLLTRITSVVAWYHLAFFVISLAMLGMTAGAVVVFVRPAWFTPQLLRRRLADSALAFALTTPLAVALALAIPLRPISDLGGFAGMLAFGASLALPFTLAGVALTLALTRAGLPAGLVYGVDLVGAAAGCAFVVPLLDWLDAPSAVLVAAAIAATGALAFVLADDGASRRRRTIVLGTAGLLAIAAQLNVDSDGMLLRPRHVKGMPDVPELYAFDGWNTYSRVTVDHTVEGPPAFWAAARTIPPELLRPIPQRSIRIDGAAGTMMAALDTDPSDDRPGRASDHAYLGWDITAFAHVLRPHGPAAVIGVGGGRDVIEAVRVGHSPVVGIELNGLIVALHEHTMRDFSGIVDLPGVELVEGEARSTMTRDERTYAVVTMSLIDTWAATGAGAYALSENGLYTVEGWRVFLGRLQQDGLFTVSRWYKPDSPGETARMLALAMETLWSLGARVPREHIVLLQSGHIATLIVSRAPLSAADLDLVQREAVARGFNMVLTPRRLPSNPLLRELAELDDRDAMWAWARAQTLDLTPPSDERPFFFNMLRPSSWLGRPEAVGELDLAFLGNLHATQTLVYATLASALLTGLAVVGPLFARRRTLAAWPRADLVAASIYFALIGFGFMFVEMALLSRLSVFLGHPTLALCVLLGGVILFTGIGSLASSRVTVQRRRVAVLYPLLPAALVAIVAIAIDPVMAALAAASTVVRVSASLVVVAIPACGMGLGFPLGLRLCARAAQRDRDRVDLGPWLWGTNGACGVVASGLGLTMSMAWGIGTTLVVGSACYVALVLCTRRLA